MSSGGRGGKELSGNSGGNSYRVLVVDDHPLFRRGLVYLLRDLPLELSIVEAECLDTALAALDGEKFDLILLDLVLPGQEPARTLERTSAAAQGARIAIVSMLDDCDEMWSALRGGAVGYIPKKSHPDLIRHAVSLMLAGGKYLPPDLIHMSAPVAVADLPAPIDATSKSLLTDRQLSVLRLVALGRSNKLVARTLGISEATVKAHLTTIMRALGVSNRVEAVMEALKRGLI